MNVEIAGYQYFIIWTVYLLAATGLSFYVFRFTRYLSWSLLRYLLRMCLVLALFMPTLVDAQRDLWAPAIISAAFDFVINGSEASFQTLRPFLLGIAMGSVILCLQAIFFWLRARFIKDL